MAGIVVPSGQRLHVEDEGLGPPVLLVHGWAMAGAILAPLGRRLGQGRRVVRYDLRGHGASAPASSATLDDHAADLAALLELLGLDKALVVAWSLGAQILLRALASVRVRGAVLVGAVVTERIIPGALSIDHGARIDLVTLKGKLIDRGGCINLIAPSPLEKYGFGEEIKIPEMNVSGFLAQAAKIDVSEIVASTGLGHGSTVPG